jgi:hypothetical protein
MILIFSSQSRQYLGLKARFITAISCFLSNEDGVFLDWPVTQTSRIFSNIHYQQVKKEEPATSFFL